MDEYSCWIKSRLRWLLPASIVMIAMGLGCGGGSGGSSAPTPTPTPINLTPIDLTSDRHVSSVVIQSGQSLAFNATRDLSVLVRDSSGTAINVTPGSVFLTVVSGSQFLVGTDGPGVRAVLPGKASVIATVDGVSSSATDVQITSDATVTATPDTYSVAPGAQQKLQFTVANAPNNNLRYQVVTPNGGTVSSDGTYTAPSKQGVYQVTATSIFDPLKSATATISVPIVISLLPAPVTLTVTATQQFVANVLGDASSNIEWSIREGDSGGTITDSGFYQAPNTPGTYHVVATSTTDRSRSATAEVLVRAGSGTVIIQ